VGLAEQSMSRLPGFAGLSPEVADKLRRSGRLECIVQAKGGLGPSPPTFQQELEVLDRIIHINTRANPAPEPHQVVAPPATRAHAGTSMNLVEAVVGTWDNDLMALTFEPGGTLHVSPRKGRSIGRQARGAWSADGQGRLHLTADKMDASAWLDGQELVVSLGGMAWKLRRA
jgi:hypothetical protein